MRQVTMAELRTWSWRRLCRALSREQRWRSDMREWRSRAIKNANFDSVSIFQASLDYRAELIGMLRSAWKRKNEERWHRLHEVVFALDARRIDAMSSLSHSDLGYFLRKATKEQRPDIYADAVAELARRRAERKDRRSMIHNAFVWAEGVMKGIFDRNKQVKDSLP